MTAQQEKSFVSDDTVATLSFDYLKQLTSLSLASAGGAITLLQISITAPVAKLLAYLAAGILFLAAIFALQAQQILVERLRANSATYSEISLAKLKMARNEKTEGHITAASFILFGAGVALLIVSLLSN